MFTGNLVKLREYKEEDAALAKEYLNDPEIKQFMFPFLPFPLTLNDELKWIQNQSSLNQNYNFAIETLAEKKYIGGCGLKNLDWKNSHVEIGIFIGLKEYHNKGYGSDALKILINFIFNEMNLNKIKLDVFAFNETAIKCYKKCGFKIEAVLKEELFRFGKYHDAIRMALFRTGNKQSS
jgi:RimJ/RimL family protein N-acetyltransferase